MIVGQTWTGNANRNFNCVIACGESGGALAIYPLDHAKCLARAKARGSTVTQIVNTQEHGDHTGGNAAMVRAIGAKPLAHQNATAATSGPNRPPIWARRFTSRSMPGALTGLKESPLLPKTGIETLAIPKDLPAVLAPPKPVDEQTRLATLNALQVLDTPAEERYDRVTRLAKRLFGVPIALVSLVDADRQWFKSCQGLDVLETGREISFCGHAILGDDILVIPDARRDERFSDNPLVVGEPRIRFYAGCPLRVHDGSRLGTLCVIDREPRDFSAEDRALLRDLGRVIEQELAAVHLATIDELTHLSNRRGFEALSHNTLSWCRRASLPASLVFLDLDGFKPINDRFGHAEGDRALRDFARLFGQTFRESDTAGRVGGDEFAVLMSGVDAPAVEPVLKRLGAMLEDHNRVQQRGYDLRFSAGVVAWDPAHHAGIRELMAAADALMYAQKRRRVKHAEWIAGLEGVKAAPLRQADRKVQLHGSAMNA